MRSIWSGSISFGLVNIPVKLYSATGEEQLDLNMLHKTDLSPIRYAKICKAEGKEIPYSEIVKGYEYTKGDYVVLTDEDFERANINKTKAINITQFIDESEIDDTLFQKPYFLEPAKGAEKPYALLREALKKSKKAAVTKFVLRTKEHLAVIQPKDKVLVLDQMRFTDEVRKPEGLNLPAENTASQNEIDMALALINQLSGVFEPSKYEDTYEQELRRVIEEKAAGKEPVSKGEEPKPTKVPDLMNVLKESLEREKQKSSQAVYH